VPGTGVNDHENLQRRIGGIAGARQAPATRAPARVAMGYAATMSRVGVAIVLCALSGCSGPGLEPPGDGTGTSFGNGEQMGGVGMDVEAPMGPTDDKASEMGDGGQNRQGEPQLDAADAGPSDGSVPTPLGYTGEGDENPYWSGLWVVEQPFHALYEATQYELQSGGALVELETRTLGGVAGDDYVTGTVADPDAGTRCAFADRWTSDNAYRLTLEARCDDGKQRSVVLRFDTAPESDPRQGLLPEIESVEGESGWTHPGPDWQFRKCGDPDECLPF